MAPESSSSIPAESHFAFAAAYSQALEALEAQEVPVGAVIVHRGEIIARARNRIVEQKDPRAHAELLAIGEASRVLANERLVECDLYSTLEPCAMCTGALVLARVRGVYFLAQDEKLPAFRKIMELKGHNHYPEWARLEISEYPASDLLREFFKNKRLSR